MGWTATKFSACCHTYISPVVITTLISHLFDVLPVNTEDYSAYMQTTLMAHIVHMHVVSTPKGNSEKNTFDCNVVYFWLLTQTTN